MLYDIAGDCLMLELSIALELEEKKSTFVYQALDIRLFMGFNDLFYFWLLELP
jgi:hypothetical protein